MVYPHSSKVVRALLGTVLMITARRSTSLIVASAYCMSAKFSGVMFLPCLLSTCRQCTCLILFRHSFFWHVDAAWVIWISCSSLWKNRTVQLWLLT